MDAVIGSILAQMAGVTACQKLMGIAHPIHGQVTTPTSWNTQATVGGESEGLLGELFERGSYESKKIRRVSTVSTRFVVPPAD